MSSEDALKNLDAAVAQLNANRQVHSVLAESLKVLAEAIKPKDKKNA